MTAACPEVHVNSSTFIDAEEYAMGPIPSVSFPHPVTRYSVDKIAAVHGQASLREGIGYRQERVERLRFYGEKCLCLRPKAELDIFSETTRIPVNYRTGEYIMNGWYYKWFVNKQHFPAL